MRYKVAPSNWAPIWYVLDTDLRAPFRVVQNGRGGHKEFHTSGAAEAYAAKLNEDDSEYLKMIGAKREEVDALG